MKQLFYLFVKKVVVLVLSKGFESELAVLMAYQLRKAGYIVKIINLDDNPEIGAAFKENDVWSPTGAWLNANKVVAVVIPNQHVANYTALEPFFNAVMDKTFLVFESHFRIFRRKFYGVLTIPSDRSEWESFVDEIVILLD